MTEKSMFWDGIVLGDCGPYQQSHLMDTFFRALWNGTGNRGVLKSYGNELAVSGSSSPLQVDTGAAMIYGMFYENDSATTLDIPTPTTGTRTDSIVVRRSWTAQTSRVARKLGLVLTQTAGSIYEIPLAQVTINSSGTITSIVDTREFCTISTAWPANIIAPGDFAVGSITPGKIPDRTRYELKGSGQLTPDATNPPTWTVGASYDYWSFAAAATNEVWAYFMVPSTFAGALNFYYWSVPNVNGAGGGAENVKWDYNLYYGIGGGAALTNATGTTNIDQQARLNTTVYRDAIVAALPAGPGQIIAFQAKRDGGAGADNYAATIRLLGIEMEWTSDS